MALAWHVVLTKPGQGLLAESCLRHALNFEVFNPKIQTLSIRRGVKTVGTRFYIPGYLFMRFDRERDTWQPINWQMGVRRILSVNPENPLPVSDQVMDVLLDKCDDNGYIREIEADESLAWLQEGRTVRVASGPFEGMRGTIKWTNGDRVRVILSFLGSARYVEMRARNLEPAVGAQ